MLGGNRQKEGLSIDVNIIYKNCEIVLSSKIRKPIEKSMMDALSNADK